MNVLLYLIALVTGMLALSGIAGAAGGAMMTLFQFSLIALVGSLLTRGFTRSMALY